MWYNKSRKGDIEMPQSSKSIKVSSETHKKIKQIANDEGCFILRLVDKMLRNYLKMMEIEK